MILEENFIIFSESQGVIVHCNIKYLLKFILIEAQRIHVVPKISLFFESKRAWICSAAADSISSNSVPFSFSASLSGHIALYSSSRLFNSSSLNFYGQEDVMSIRKCGNKNMVIWRSKILQYNIFPIIHILPEGIKKKYICR